MTGSLHSSVSGTIARRPTQRYTFDVSFGCAPENIGKLEKAVFDEIQSIRKRGIDEDTIDRVKELRRRAHETNMKENRFWLSELEQAYTYGDDPRLIRDAQSMIARVTSDRVKAARRKYLGDQYILGELRPQPTLRQARTP